MSRSGKVQGIQRWALEQRLGRDPESVREELAHGASRAAVTIPECLSAPADARPWQARAYGDAWALYRSVAVAGVGGVELRGLGSELGQERRNSALKVLRTSGAVTESRERREGSGRELIVLRAAEQVGGDQ